METQTQTETGTTTTWDTTMAPPFASVQINSAQAEKMELIQKTAETFWNVLQNVAVEATNGEAARAAAVAKTHLETAVMWGTKAVSRSIQ